MNAMLKCAMIALSLTFSVGMIGAQDKGNLSTLSKVIAGNENNEVSYLIPPRPEDISPLLIGEKIPVAMLPDASGRDIDLNKLISEKPTILIFYRGGWCPYCSRQLSGLQRSAPQLEKLGYQLIAVSTDMPGGLAESVKKERLNYTLLSDADLSLAKKFGIAFKAPKGYWEMLPKTTGGKNKDLLLPVPSVFILDKTGTIQFEYINPDFKQRMSSELLTTAATVIKKEIK
ncbi:peroxiredoxin-like family protein [Niabella sp. 22666]|uniref:peroxiredoxin-like family protein n=1 Tax=Niabella sp. 22666 TaxID=3453954 RepID=UPI003F8726E7